MGTTHVGEVVESPANFNLHPNNLCLRYCTLLHNLINPRPAAWKYFHRHEYCGCLVMPKYLFIMRYLNDLYWRRCTSAAHKKWKWEENGFCDIVYGETHFIRRFLYAAVITRVCGHHIFYVHGNISEAIKGIKLYICICPAVYFYAREAFN